MLKEPREVANKLSQITKSVDCTRYISADGSICFRTYSDIPYYFLICSKLGIIPKTLESGLHYEAEGYGFTLVYCEHDLILAFNGLSWADAASSENFDFIEYSINEDNRIRATECSFSDDKKLLFGCWLQDGYTWEVLGYAKKKEGE